MSDRPTFRPSRSQRCSSSMTRGQAHVSPSVGAAQRVHHVWLADARACVTHRDWGRDLQLVLDLVRADSGVFGTVKDPKDASQWAPEKQIPVHFSNPDLLWGNEFSVSRFGQGALQESIAAVYKTITGYELQR